MEFTHQMRGGKFRTYKGSFLNIFFIHCKPWKQDERQIGRNCGGFATAVGEFP